MTTIKGLQHIVTLHDMNACRLVDAIAKAEPLRIVLIEKAMAAEPACEVKECGIKLDPAKPSGWIVEWNDPKQRKRIQTWCCDAHYSQVEQGA